MRHLMPTPIAAFVLALLVAFACAPNTSEAAELIMVEQKNCHWCDKWNAEVGVTYQNTPVGRIAPLRRVDIADPVPADLTHINLGRATPVFILIDDGVEIGRVRGYPGVETFWLLLKEQLVKLPALQPQRPEERPKERKDARPSRT